MTNQRQPMTESYRLFRWRTDLATKGWSGEVTCWVSAHDIRGLRDVVLAEHPNIDAIAGRWDGI